VSGSPTAQLARPGGHVLRPVSVLSVATAPVPKRVEPRVRLVRHLLATTQTRVVLMSAPAGYGKTALLEAWASAEARPMAWVTVERAADASVAMTELEAAIDAARDAERPSVLVVDNAEAAQGVVAAAALRAVERELPSCVTVVLSGRAVLPYALGRLRSAWPILELRAKELAMTHNEAAALLDAAGVAVSGDGLATLMARTEGWPCALRLAIVALSGEADVDAAIADFGGDDRVVADYVRDEILAELPAERLEFLTTSSVLEPLTGPVCDAVLKRHDSGGVLFDLGRSPVPIRPTDRSEQHFHLHPLVAGMLQTELHRRDPERERALHARATDYYAEAGELGAALGHAIAGEDYDRATALLWGLTPGALFDGRSAQLRAYLADIGEAQVGRRPVLALVAALTALADAQREQAQRWLVAVRRAADHDPSAAGAGVDTALALLHVATASGDVATLRDHARAAMEITPDGSPWRAVCSLLRGAANGLLGDTEAAARDLEDGVRRGAVVMPAVEALCLTQLALHALVDGDAREGAALADRARTRIDTRGLSEPTTRGLVCAVSAFARAQRGRVAEARADADVALRDLGAGDAFMPWYDAQARVALARAHLRLGDVTAARAFTAEAARWAARMPDAAGLRAWIDDSWARSDTFAVEALASPASLTTAELRVLRFLPSHLSFREIAERLNVSANTVKTQAHAVYRKLDASSRSSAVTRARTVGLLDP
jgi:LuxR family transcriptional regulator, maltose regulon positive regulatory protein